MGTDGAGRCFHYHYPHWPVRRWQATATVWLLAAALAYALWILGEGVPEPAWCWALLALAALVHLLSEDRIRSYRSRVDYVRVTARRLVWHRWPFVRESVALEEVQEVEVSIPPRGFRDPSGRHLFVFYPTGSVDLGGEAELDGWGDLARVLVERCRLHQRSREAFGALRLTHRSGSAEVRGMADGEEQQAADECGRECGLPADRGEPRG
jgi:hypothetical protein